MWKNPLMLLNTRCAMILHRYRTRRLFVFFRYKRQRQGGFGFAGCKQGAAAGKPICICQTRKRIPFVILVPRLLPCRDPAAPLGSVMRHNILICLQTLWLSSSIVVVVVDIWALLSGCSGRQAGSETMKDLSGAYRDWIRLGWTSMYVVGIFICFFFGDVLLLQQP